MYAASETDVGHAGVWTLSLEEDIKRNPLRRRVDVMELLSRGGQRVSISAKFLWTQRNVCSGSLLVSRLCTQHSVIDVTNVTR